MLRILIIEDEAATARNLQFTLQKIRPEITILEVLDSVKTSIEWLQTRPGDYDLLFVDIRLSDGLSFKIFDRVKIKVPIIFVTAYDNYALQAFKTSGIDYILKPFDTQELSLALQKYDQLIGTKPEKEISFSELADHLKNHFKSYKQSFLFHHREKLVPVPVKEIAWFYTQHEVTYANCFDKRKFTMEQTLETLSQQLDPADFFRANRQFIIQRKAIQEVNYYFTGRLWVVVTPEPEEKILISKAKVAQFKEWLDA